MYALIYEASNCGDKYPFVADGKRQFYKVLINLYKLRIIETLIVINFVNFPKSAPDIKKIYQRYIETN